MKEMGPAFPCCTLRPRPCALQSCPRSLRSTQLGQHPLPPQAQHSRYRADTHWIPAAHQWLPWSRCHRGAPATRAGPAWEGQAGRTRVWRLCTAARSAAGCWWDGPRGTFSRRSAAQCQRPACSAHVQAQYGPLTGFLMRWPGGSLGSSGASAAGSAAAAGCSAGGASTTTSSWLMLRRHEAIRGAKSEMWAGERASARTCVAAAAAAGRFWGAWQRRVADTCPSASRPWCGIGGAAPWVRRCRASNQNHRCQSLPYGGATVHRLPQIAAGSVLQRHWSRGAQPLAPDRTWLGLERAGARPFSCRPS